MTKSVRIENADCSDHKVTVQVWRFGKENEPHELIEEVRLDYPTAMISKGICKEQYLVIKEE